MSDFEIVWTKVDEAPALATFSLLPIVEAFVGAAGVKMKLKDISLTGRIIANFPDKLTPAQEVELLTIVPPARLKAMKASGHYDHYRVGIAHDGTWHFFDRPN